MLPETLLSPANEAKFLKLYHDYLDKAESHLRAGWIYTNTLPFGQFRVRLACAWPILIGVRTIEKLRVANVIELQQRVKVSRGEVRGILLRSVLASPFPGAWRRLFPASGKAVASGDEIGVKKTSCESPSCGRRSARRHLLRGRPVRPRAGQSGAGRRPRGIDGQNERTERAANSDDESNDGTRAIVTPTGTIAAQPSRREYAAATATLPPVK